MELITKQIELRKLTATEGMYLTQADDSLEERTYTKSVYLGKDELVENWREATEEEKQTYEVECERRAKEYEKMLSGKVE